MNESELKSVLQGAIRAHQGGRLAEAEASYRGILADHPQQPDALHFLGLLHFHKGDAAEALRLIEQSLLAAPDNPHAWNNVGNILLMQDRADAAQTAYRQVIRLAPAMSETWYNLGICLRDTGEFEAAAKHFREAISHSPRFFRAYETLAMLYYRLGLNAEAAETYGEWSRLDPGNAKARHMAAATSGQDVPARASDAYVKLLFDKAASSFDRNLKQLGYRAPEIVASALREHAAGSTSRALDVLDAGCGTGLCGPLMRQLCRTLAGVDLSPKMIEHARERGVYDELIAAEMTAFIQSRPGAFDAIVSADTLVYFGSLEDFAAAAREALRPGGILIATVEALTDPAVPFRLESHGRYAHGEPYLRRTLCAAGFDETRILEEVLRQERLQDVKGYLILARRSA